MDDETPEQDRNMHKQTVMYELYQSGMLAWKRDKIAERKRQVHIDALKKAVGVS